MSTPTNESNEPLKVKVTGDRLVMSIGLETLKWASSKRNGGPLPYRFRVADRREFGMDVARAVTHQDEIGNAMIDEMLDAAIQKAADNGSTGLHYPNTERSHGA